MSMFEIMDTILIVNSITLVVNILNFILAIHLNSKRNNAGIINIHNEDHNEKKEEEDV